MGQGDYERAAERIRALAGMDSWDVWAGPTIARAVFGDDGFAVVHGLRSHGELQTWDGGGQVRVAPGDAIEQSFAGAHELAHLALDLEDSDLEGDELEQACNCIAGAILMPAAPFLEALDTFGDDWSELALLFGVSETAVCLRVGELTGRAIAVVAPDSVRVRGNGVWPPEQILRRMHRKERPGLAVAMLRDDPRRHVLVVVEDPKPKSSAS